jgi:hypothetical protein
MGVRGSGGGTVSLPRVSWMAKKVVVVVDVVVVVVDGNV